MDLIAAYRENEELKKVVRKLMAIGFLPLHFIRGAFQILYESAIVSALMIDYTNFRGFFEYVRSTYIEAESNFPPHKSNFLWHRQMDTMTTNNVESFHHKINATISVRHPLLWLFIRHLKDFHASAELIQRNAEMGLPRPLKKRKWRILEENLRRLEECWSSVCYYVKEFIPHR